MFDTVLIANRGEIAVRICRTLRVLGIRSATVFSDADANSVHVRAADVAVRIGPPPALESYLSIERVIAAGRAVGADAVHPGYGFLAENAKFAVACSDAGMAFIGPSAAAIALMGDKIRAKQTVAVAGVPVVPGRAESGLSDASLIDAASEVGYPVLIKPAAGGGGKGMHLVRDPTLISAALASARREALAAFDDDTLFVERFIEHPRHIEIQVLADRHGGAVHLGDRECSLQRRHQKIIEEAPSPLLGAALREIMGEKALSAARACDYVNAGTVEFIVSADRPDEFFFMEMNTRLQVEHPVTEMVWGVDLVELQLRVAAGEPLPFTQDDLKPHGHAVEARVYAEDPTRGFLPSGGLIIAHREPSEGLARIDSGVEVGSFVSGAYDPMLSKVISWAPVRSLALGRLRRALADYVILGVTTNVAFLRSLLEDTDVQAGRLDTGLVERKSVDLLTPDVPDDVVIAAAIAQELLARPAGVPSDPWDVPDGWRLSDQAWTLWQADIAGRGTVRTFVRRRGVNFEVRVDEGASEWTEASLAEETLSLRRADTTSTYAVAATEKALWIAQNGSTWVFREPEALTRSGLGGPAGVGAIRSPMPGTVAVVAVDDGDRVVAGQAVVVIEAMKMEHTLIAPFDGVVAVLSVTLGQQVALNEVVAVIVSDLEPKEDLSGQGDR